VSDLRAAARKHDHISHSASELGGEIGVGVGLVAVGLLALSGLFTEGAGTVAAIGLGVTIVNKVKGWGEFVGGFFTRSGAGEIAKGANTVFEGVEVREAARMTDPVTCHSGGKLHTASKTVIVEGHNASRLGSKTSCGGQVSDACKNVFYGGPEVAADASRISEQSSLLYRILSKALDWGELLNPEGRLLNAALLGAGEVADYLGGKDEFGAAKDGVQAGKDVVNAWRGKGSPWKAADSVSTLGKDGVGLGQKYGAPTPEVVGTDLPPGYKP